MENVAKNEEVNALMSCVKRCIDIETGEEEYFACGQGVAVRGNELEEVAAQFSALIEKMIANPTAYERPRPRVAYAGIKFKRSECRGMEKTFRQEFAAVGRIARVSKRENDDRQTFTYTIWYNSNAYNFRVSSTDLREAKRLFVEETHKGARV